MISIGILETDEQIIKMMNQELATEMSNVINRAAQRIESEIVSKIYDWFIESPEIQSLEDSSPGSLASQFGIPYGEQESTQQAIVDAIVKSLTVKVHKIGKNLDGVGLEIVCQPTDFQNLLNMTEATIDIGYRKLDWLEWILKEGASIIVLGYTYHPKYGFGRSTGGIMVKKGHWRVPSEYSGVETNNFITRAFEGREREITEIIEGALR